MILGIERKSKILELGLEKLCYCNYTANSIVYILNCKIYKSINNKYIIV